MRADRNHIIEILQDLHNLPDGYGGFTENWVVTQTLYSTYEPIFGRDYFSADQTQNGTTVKFELEYVEGITRDMRVRHKNKLYEINSDPIDVKGRGITLIIYCKDVV